MLRDNEERRKKDPLGVTATSCVILSKSLLPREVSDCRWMIRGMDVMIFQVPSKFGIVGLNQGEAFSSVGERGGDPWELMVTSELRLPSLCVHVPPTPHNRPSFHLIFPCTFPSTQGTLDFPLLLLTWEVARGESALGRAPRSKQTANLVCPPPTWGSPRSEQGGFALVLFFF